METFAIVPNSLQCLAACTMHHAQRIARVPSKRNGVFYPESETVVWAVTEGRSPFESGYGARINVSVGVDEYSPRRGLDYFPT